METDKWHLGQLTLASSDVYYDLVIEGTIGNESSSGFMALDDFKTVFSQACEPTESDQSSSSSTQASTTTPRPVEVKFACNFEKSMCEWNATQGEASKLRWTRQSGHAALHGVGPLSDVTNKNALGHYVLVNGAELSAESAWEDVVLASPAFESPGDITCLEFWYQVSGPTQWSLSVNVIDESHAMLETIFVWKRLGSDESDTWKHAYVNLPRVLDRKSVQFSGEHTVFFSLQTKKQNKKLIISFKILSNQLAYVPGRRLRGYVAIDDVNVQMAECPATRFCDFEGSDKCGYENDVTGVFPWDVHTGWSSSSGPSTDHTYNTPAGHYMRVFTRNSLAISKNIS